MKREQLDSQVSISGQIGPEELKLLAEEGVELLICNRPDGEESEQMPFDQIARYAKEFGIEAASVPFASTEIKQEDRDEFAKLLALGKRTHAYCRSGARCKRIWQAVNQIEDQNVNANADNSHKGARYDVLIIGAGSAGIATASSIKKRQKNVRIGLIDPSDEHYYQPGWTMVGGGAFNVESTHRKMAMVIPRDCDWLRAAAVKIEPNSNSVELSDGSTVYYEHLVVAPGLILNWEGIEGLQETLGRNGVTSNYRYELAPYTWKLVQNMTHGRALFTQPPMPIKCAGAPQKAMYLSCSEWLKQGRLDNIDVQFYTSGDVLFGVADYVPTLMGYVEKYGANLNFKRTLIKVDGSAKIAWFKDGDGHVSESPFDMLHVCPPQVAPHFVRASGLADEGGWLSVDPSSLQSTQYDNIWGVGDVLATANAKTMAAARKQAPVVAQNIANALANKAERVAYDGYGSCPLTVERGKIVLAEFGYGGKLLPTIPSWINEGTQATKLAWMLKVRVLPPLYWDFMLKGREWLAKP